MLNMLAEGEDLHTDLENLLKSRWTKQMYSRQLIIYLRKPVGTDWVELSEATFSQHEFNKRGEISPQGWS
jgi:hypothetical protein